MKKRVLSVLLALCMVLSLLPIAAFAAEADHAIQLELVKDTTTFASKSQEVLRVDFKYTSGATDTPNSQKVYLKYNAAKLAPLVASNGNDASSILGDTFSLNKASTFVANTYVYTYENEILGEQNVPAEVMFYTTIESGYGYICWTVTENGAPPAFSEVTLLGSIFFGLKDGVTFDTIPGDAFKLATVAEDTSVTAQSCTAEVVYNGSTKIGYLTNTTSEEKLAKPEIKAGEGVTLVKPDYAGAAAGAPTMASKKGGTVTLNPVVVTGETVQYAYSKGTTAPTNEDAWQDEVTFTDVPAGTVYFFARVKANDEHGAGGVSNASAAITVYGPISLGYTAPETLTYNTAITEMSPTVSGGTGTYTNYALTGGTSLPSGLTLSATDGKITGTPNATTSGTTQVKVQVTDSEGVTQTATVTFPKVGNAKAKVDKAPTGKTPTYSGTPQDLIDNDGTATGGTLQYSLNKTSGYGTDIPKGTDAGPYTVWYKAVGAANYDDSDPASLTVTIGRKDPVVGDFNDTTGPTAHFNYGDEITVTTPSLKSPLTKAGAVTVKYNGSATVPEDAGTYALTFDVAEGTNFNSATGLNITNDLVIDKVTYPGTKTASDNVKTKIATTDKTVTLPTLPAGAAYAATGTVGGTTPALIDGTPTVSGTTLTYSTTNQASPTSATITVQVTGATNYNNYEVVVTVNAVDKTTANPTVPASPVNKTYGTGDFTVTATKATAVGSDASQTWSWAVQTGTSVAIKSGANAAVVTLEIKSAGDTTLKVTFESENYIGEATVTVHVDKATPTVTAPTPKSLTYTGGDQALVEAATTTGGTLKYSLDNSAYGTDIPKGNDAKEYTVWYKVEGNANYNDVAAKNVTVTIAKATPEGTVTRKGSATQLFNSNTVADLVAQLEWTGTKPAAASGDSITVSEKVLTVGDTEYHWTYTSANTNYDPKSGTVTVNVKENKLDSLLVSGTLAKSEYFYGDTFEPDGLTIKAKFANGDETPLDLKDVVFNGGQPLTTVGASVPVSISYTNNNVTKESSVNVKVDRKPISLAGMSWTGSTPFTFDGTEKSMTLSGTLPEGVRVSAKTGDTATEVGEYTASATFALAEGYSAANYELTGTNPLTKSWSITQATATNGSTDVKVRYTNTETQTVALTSYIPKNAGAISDITAVKTTDADSVIATVAADKEAKTATFKLASGLTAEKVSKTAELTVTIKTKNYKDITVTINVTVSDKDTPVITAEDIIKTYDGKPLENSAIQGTATFEEADVAGAWSFKVSTGLTDVADSGSKVVRFTPEESDKYEVAETTITVTINKATPAGSPGFSAVSSAGMTLADVMAEGAMNDVFKAADGTTDLSGTFAWDLGAATEVTQGTAYAWTFTPADTANYNNATGSYTPWSAPVPVISGGGSSAPAPSVTAPVSGDAGGVTVPVTVSGSEATVGAIDPTDLDKIVDASTEPVDVVIDLTGLGGDIDKASISSDDLQTVADAANAEDNGISGLEIKLSTATVALDGAALNAVLDAAGTAQVTIAVENVETAGLDEAQQAAVNELTAPAVLDAYFLAGSERISSFEGGTVKITVPYELEDGQVICVNYVAEDGTLTPVEATYNAADKTVTFFPPHFSYYVVSADGVAECDGGESCPAHDFSDVDTTLWYHKAVDYAITNKLMSGDGTGKFAPLANLSRAMLCQILYNLEGKPAVESESPFSDVPAGAWYTDAVIWAYENEIVFGYDTGKFGPNDNITREQLAAILWRYAGSPAIDRMDSLAEFTDRAKVSSYAETAVQWAVKQGVISGKGNGILDPLGNAMRAEVAQMLMNYLTKKA